MANFHSDEWVHEQIARHHDFALSLYNSDQIVGVFCQGSTNYGLDTPDSDIDTKCIVVPTFKDVALARKPVSTTHVLPNTKIPLAPSLPCRHENHLHLSRTNTA